MREIKFRAWDKLHKRLADVLRIDFEDSVALLKDPEDIWTVGFKDIVFEQCTDLKDKNDRLIYEGDVIKTRNGKIQEVINLTGKFDNENMTSQFTCFFAGWKKMEPSKVVGYYFSETDEVIGNIHQDADLLEGV